jgi:hypothetical protein
MNKYLPKKFVKLPGYNKGIEFLGKEYFVTRII